MAAPTSRPPRPCSPSLPGLALRLRSAAHSSSGRRHVRPGAGAPARPAQPPQPLVARGPILPPLSAWSGGLPPALPARVGSGRDEVGWQRGQTPSPPPPSSIQRDWGSRGRGWGGGPAPPRGRPRQGGPTAVATACEGRWSLPLPEPGEQRAANRKCPSWGKSLADPRCPCEGAGGSAVPARRRSSPLTRDGEHQISSQQPRVTMPKPTHAHLSPEPGKPRSHKAGKSESKLTPGRVSKNATNSVMEPIER